MRHAPDRLKDLLSPLPVGIYPISGGVDYSSFIHKDGELRLYDATATPNFINILFMDAGFTAPLGRPRYEERLVLDRGTHATLSGSVKTHYIKSSDEAMMAPLDLSFNFRWTNAEPNYSKFRQALNVDIAATWKVGTVTWVTTKGTSTILNSAKTPVSVTTPIFTDGRKRTVNVEVLWTDPISGGVSDAGIRWREVHFPPDAQRLTENEDSVMIACAGRIYGDIQVISAFSAGTAS